VSDHGAGAPFQQVLQRLLDQPFRARIHAGGRFILHQYSRV
jgi:hypothetical protein